MNIIKQIREKHNYTQQDLAKKTGLSLRTIQRLESNNKAPKGHSLKALSEAFNIDPTVLKNKFVGIKKSKDADILSIKIINLSVLGCFGIPFGNLILPILLWKRKRQSKLVDETGRKIINFQIIWSILLSFSLIVAPFADNYIVTSHSLILIVLFTALAINIIFVSANAIMLQRNNITLLNPPIKFL